MVSLSMVPSLPLSQRSTKLYMDGHQSPRNNPEHSQNSSDDNKNQTQRCVVISMETQVSSRQPPYCCSCSCLLVEHLPMFLKRQCGTPWTLLFLRPTAFNLNHLHKMHRINADASVHQTEAINPRVVLTSHIFRLCSILLHRRMHIRHIEKMVWLLHQHSKLRKHGHKMHKLGFRLELLGGHLLLQRSAGYRVYGICEP